MTAFIVIGCMIAFGCMGASVGAFEDRKSDLPGFGFMLFGLMGVVAGAVIGAILATIVT